MCLGKVWGRFAVVGPLAVISGGICKKNHAGNPQLEEFVVSFSSVTTSCGYLGPLSVMFLVKGSWNNHVFLLSLEKKGFMTPKDTCFFLGKQFSELSTLEM